MSEARKVWTKQAIKKPLEVIAPALKELEGLAGAGQMPYSLRRKVINTSAKVRSLLEELNNWAITSGQKAIVDRQEEGPRTTSQDVGEGGGGRATGERGSGSTRNEATLPSPDLYTLKDGRSFKTLQDCFDALGLPKDKRPKHNRYERLSKDLKAKITENRR